MAATAKRSVNIYVNGTDAEKTMNEISEEIRKQENEWRKLKKGTLEYMEAAKEIRKLKALQEEHNKVMETTDEKIKRIRENFLRLGAGLGGFTQVITTIKNSLNYLRDFATELAKLDDIMHKVRKTTGLTIEEIQDLNRCFMTIDTRTSREELNELAYAAGKLGINTKEGVLQFVKAADEINVALGDVLGGTDSIIEITKMMEVFKQSTKEIAGEDLQQNLIKTGSVLNELGKRSTANEKNMAAFLGRISGVSSQLGISLDQAAGFASVFDQTKQHVEMSATALQRMFTEMIKKPGEYAKAAGMELKEFKDLMQNDFNEAVIKVLEGFSKAGGMEPLVQAFKDMGLDGQRAVSAITQLASHTDLLRTAQEQASEAIKEGTSTGKEYATMNESMQAQMEKARKAVQDARIELGEKMYPVTLKVLSLRGKFIKWLSEMSQKTVNLYAILASTTLLIGQQLAPKIKNLYERLKNSQTAITLKTIAHRKELIAIAEADIKEKERLLTLAKMEAAQKRLVVKLNATSKANKELSKAEAKVVRQEKELANSQNKRNNLSGLEQAKSIWMLILQVIIAVVTAVVNLIKKLGETRKMLREMNSELTRERAKVNQLFMAYKNLNKYSSERARILKIIMDKYGTYMQNLVDEKGNLKDVAAAQKAVNDELERSIRLKYAQQGEDKINKKYNKKIGRKAKRTLKKVGAENMDFVYEWIDENMKYQHEGMFDEKTLKKMSPTIQNEVRNALANLRFGLLRGGVSGEDIDAAIRQVEKLYKKTRNYQREITWNNDTYGLNPKRKIKQEPVTGPEIVITPKTDDEPFAKLTEGADESAKQIAAKWKSLLERISDLNRKYEIKETPMSEAKQQIMKDYKEMKDAVQDFYEEHTAYKAKGDAEIKKLDEEMWKQIRRLDTEEREKALKAIEDRLKGVSERMEAFRLKQRRKSQSKLETDLDEISLDFSRLTHKIEDEIKTLEEKGKAGFILQSALMTEEGAEKQLEEAAAVLEKYGITLEEIAKYKEEIKGGKTISDILTMLGLGVTDKEKKKIEDLYKLIKEFNKVGVEEAGIRVKESMEELQRDYMSTGRKIYEEQMKSLELQLKTVEAAEKYYKSLKNGDRIVQNLGKYKEKLTGKTVSIGEKEYTLSEVAEMAGIAKQKMDINKGKRNTERKAKGKSNGVWELFGIEEKDWKDWKYNWLENLDAIANSVENWADSIMNTMQYVFEYENNAIEAQTKKIEEEYDSRSEEYRRLLENNVISQKYYDAQMEKLEKDKTEQENKLKRKQFNQEKNANMAQAIINGIGAAITSFKNGGGFPYGLIPMALSLATTGAQVAAINSQVNPYAKGSYIRGPQLALMGEEGDEWVASHKLLKDRKSASIIEALDQYQKGNRTALETISIAVPNPEKLSRAVSTPVPTFAPSNQTTTTNNYYQNSDDSELLKEIRQMNKYLKDPRNRQAVINRKILLEYERMEDELKSMARL